jgi:glycosyltransferase involved in cell wall biosynthesis
MKHILYVGAFRFPTGDAAAQRVLGIAKALAAAGYRVCIGSGSATGREQDRSPNGDYIYQGFLYTPLGYLRSQSMSPLSRVWRYCTAGKSVVNWVETLADDNCAAVIVYSPGCELIWRLLPLCKKRAVPLIVDVTEWQDGTQLPGGRWGPIRFDQEICMRYLQKQASGIIAISSYLQTYYEARTRPAIRIPPLVDLREPKWQVGDDSCANRPLRIVYAGTPGKRKDLFREIVRGFRLASRGRDGMEFHVLGGADPNMLDGMGTAAAGGASGRIVWHGQVPHELVPQYLAAADFSVLLRRPERYAMAGFPTKVVESLATGTPVIVNHTSDLSEYIRDGKEGIVVDGYSAEGLAAALERAASLGQSDRSRMRLAAQQRALASFDYTQYVDAIREFIRAQGRNSAAPRFRSQAN